MSKSPGVSPLSHHSDGEPKEISKVSKHREPLKTNYKSLPKRYELAERQVWSKIPKWKQDVIADCKTNGTKDRVFDEYAKEIISLAENDKTEFDESLPEVPKAAEVIDSAVIENPS